MVRSQETVLARLLRLDDGASPGLSEHEFRRLFVQCRCGLVMTCRVFKMHTCRVVIVKPHKVIIDLTSEDEDVIDLTTEE
jgi:hypothetical protein